MSEPIFLSLQQVEKLHKKVIERFGGIVGVRDLLGFEGAVIHPRNVYYYAQGDLFDIAAAYAFHIAEAQALMDGNKRTAMAAALTFLEGKSGADPGIYAGFARSHDSHCQKANGQKTIGNIVPAVGATI